MKCDADICKNLQVNVEFPGGITIDFLTMHRTISMPQIGGLVQRREVTSVGLESLLDNDGSSLAVSVLGQLTLDVTPSITDCWMRHLPRISVQGALSFGVACPCNSLDTCSPHDLQQE